jgi:hypothetical protein
VPIRLSENGSSEADGFEDASDNRSAEGWVVYVSIAGND